MKTALIDGDIIVYSCGFASDAAAKANGLVAEPLAYCLNGVKETLLAITAAAGCDSFVVFLTNTEEGGYRSDAYPDYKMNRSGNKPQHYHAIRDYLLDHYSAELSKNGREADDELGIAMSSGMWEHPVLCTKDKDLDMIPGWHYNFSKTKKERGVYFVTEIEANRNFYTQMLTGDSTDNIPGMYATLGVKATKKWLEPLQDLTSEDEMYAYVWEVYHTLACEQKKKGREVHNNIYEPAALDSYLLLLGTLLWIQRKEDGLWFPPFGPHAKTKAVADGVPDSLEAAAALYEKLLKDEIAMSGIGFTPITYVHHPDGG